MGRVRRHGAGPRGAEGTPRQAHRPPPHRGRSRLGHDRVHAARRRARHAQRSSQRSRRSSTSTSSTSASASSSTSSSRTRRRCRTTPTTPRSSASRERDWDRARRVPVELATELALVGAQSYEVWVKAREDSDFAAFAPWLERVLELRRRYIECFAPYDDAYDVLLEDYEPGMRTSEIREIFAVLTPELRALVAEHATDDEDEFMRGPFPIEGQEALSRELVEAIGATLGPVPARHDRAPVRDHVRARRHPAHDPLHGGRPELALHGAARGRARHLRVGRQPDARADAALRMGASTTLARVAEPALGERRRALAAVLALVLPARAGDLPGAGSATCRSRSFHRAVNRARRSFIRVDADETSYGLHVILRFELEQELISGRLAVKDLPEAWNSPLRGADRPHSAERRARRAPGRALVAGQLRLLPDLPPRHRALGPDLGEGAGGDFPTSRSRSSAESSPTSTRGSARTSTRSVGSSRRPRRSSVSSAGRSTRSRTSPTYAPSSAAARRRPRGRRPARGRARARAPRRSERRKQFRTPLEGARSPARATRRSGTRGSR